MPDLARDRFERYFSEKLWEGIPSVYRHEDGLGLPPAVLRSAVEIIAERAAALRRSHDRLWDDQSIDVADDWAIAYLADLVGTRLVSALMGRERRADVANTIHYRRRAGTLALLETLIGDIAGWEGSAVELFRRLGRSWHRLDPRPLERRGLVTRTPPGGTADLRSPRVRELVGSAFDELCYSLDPRRARGRQGFYAIPKVAFFLDTLRAFQVIRADPFPLADGVSFTFDPSGRDLPLFARRARSSADAWRKAREWELPRPIKCGVLRDARYSITDAVIVELIRAHGLAAPAAEELRKLRGVSFAEESRLALRLQELPSASTLSAPLMYRAILQLSLTESSALGGLYPASLAVEESLGDLVPRTAVTAGALGVWTTPGAGKRLVIDPERGRFQFQGAPPPGPVQVQYCYGFSGPIGAGPFDRRGELAPPASLRTGGGTLTSAGALGGAVVTELGDSRTYGPLEDVIDISKMVVQAKNFERPYLKLGGDWVLATLSAGDAELALSGLWLGALVAGAVVLRGDYRSVVLRHVTLDPGGKRADGATLPALTLRVEGRIEELRVESSILAGIEVLDSALVERLVVHDSIIGARGSARALRAPRGETELSRVTLLGSSELHRLSASEVLSTGLMQVLDTQHGCFRFSTSVALSRVPHPHESYFSAETRSWFVSREFGQPGYCQLSRVAPSEVRRGAENGSEMGAFSALHSPLREDALLSKVEEYMPFGLVPAMIRET